MESRWSERRRLQKEATRSNENLKKSKTRNKGIGRLDKTRIDKLQKVITQIIKTLAILGTMLASKGWNACLSRQSKNIFLNRPDLRE
jgi:hypothetical protein